MQPEVTDAVHVTSGRNRDIAPKLGFALPESKFQPPVARPGIVARTALVGQLLGTQAPVITVAAPPGYGKTTLMAQWAERIGPRAAWLSCDEGDNDPVVLLSALAVALDRIAPVDPGIFSALASSGADITAIPRFVAAVASVRSPVTVALAGQLQAALATTSARAAGASSLTAAELRLLPLLSTHLSYAEIGDRLHVSTNTVKTQAYSAYRKLGISSRSEAVVRTRELGLDAG